MGHLQATEMAAIAESNLALTWHLQSNHFPPVHLDFLPVAKQAIDAGVESYLAEDYAPLEEVVTMPNGIEKSLGDIVDGLHLDAFIDQQLSEYLEDGEE